MPDGSKIYALGESGMIAEKAVVSRDKIIPVPKGLDDAVAAALPNAVAGSALALLFRGKMKDGDTVLINGATGFTGTLAVQLAKHYGAGKIIVTGRNEQSLNNLLNLGADEIVSLHTQKGEDFIENIKAVNAAKPIDVVVDYLWGNSAEWILSSLKGNGKFSRKINFVSVGAMSGDTMQLSSQILRSVDLHLCGSGIGSWTKDEMNLLFKKIIPEVFQLAAENKLQVNITKVPLADIERISTMELDNLKSSFSDNV
ncbi:MAG: zinc-binding alcohol dehydrogenase family protein [Arachidicoccus sp.]|nr:zinc-binding alcohol dehydrogenase family protein [Arachidicoccus sp.]